MTFIIILVAYFGPLFLLPMTFKWAGGALGMINDRLGKLGGRLNKSGQGWLDKQRGRTKWALDKQAREKGRDAAAQERWSRSFNPEAGTGRLGRLTGLNRTGVNRIRQGGLFGSRYGHREAIPGIYSGAQAEDVEFDEAGKQLAFIDRGLQKPEIEAHYKALLAANRDEVVGVKDGEGNWHRITVTEGVHRQALAKAAQFQDQTEVDRFISVNGGKTGYGGTVLRKNSGRDFNAYANLVPHQIFPGDFTPTSTADKDGLKILRIGIGNYGSYDTAHQQRVRDGLPP